MRGLMTCLGIRKTTGSKDTVFPDRKMMLENFNRRFTLFSIIVSLVLPSNLTLLAEEEDAITPIDPHYVSSPRLTALQRAQGMELKRSGHSILTVGARALSKVRPRWRL